MVLHASGCSRCRRNALSFLGELIAVERLILDGRNVAGHRTVSAVWWSSRGGVLAHSVPALSRRIHTGKLQLFCAAPVLPRRKSGQQYPRVNQQNRAYLETFSLNVRFTPESGHGPCNYEYAPEFVRTVSSSRFDPERPCGLRAACCLTTSAVASVDSIGRRADPYWQVGSSNCAGKRNRSRRCSQRGH